eukprot:TRINITY_DN6747_c0_g1_i1.p1 TRINITY_DN6747_c0_g1~~TRINITY_DN6747_c0_g1_i1.p1  ORF type:complete len:205 (+),score=47.40 TRINITY_DN6747_c0_g1_i1:55-669(+)
MMKVILSVALLVAFVSAQQFCVDLVVDDVSCEGFRANWPTKVCNTKQENSSSSAVCDAGQFLSYYNIWADICPLKNSGNQTFCEGKGYLSAYNQWTNPCYLLVGCTTDDDCNPVAPPTDNAPIATPPLACYDCCLYCFDDATCQTKNTTFTKDANCTPCKPVEPVAAPTAGNPSTTPTKVNAPNTGAVVVASTTVLAFVAALLL